METLIEYDTKTQVMTTEYNSVALESDGITAGNQGPRSETTPLSAVEMGLGVTVQAFSEENKARGAAGEKAAA